MGEKGVTIYELNSVIGERVKGKEGLRQEILSDPKAALEKEFNVMIPDNFKVEVHVETPTTLHIILPAENALELTEDQLDQVAGGTVAFEPGDMMMAYGVPGQWYFDLEKFKWPEEP